MKKAIVFFAISALEIIFTTANAGISGRFCLQFTKTNGPNIGATNITEVVVDKVGRNVSSIVGRACSINPVNGRNDCVAQQGTITIDTDGSIKLTLVADVQTLSDQGVKFITTRGELNIDPITLKGLGAQTIQITDGRTVTFSTATNSGEIVACPPPTKESIRESSQFKSFIRNASKR